MFNITAGEMNWKEGNSFQVNLPTNTLNRVGKDDFSFDNIDTSKTVLKHFSELGFKMFGFSTGYVNHNPVNPWFFLK